MFSILTKPALFKLSSTRQFQRHPRSSKHMKANSIICVLDFWKIKCLICKNGLLWILCKSSPYRRGLYDSHPKLTESAFPNVDLTLLLSFDFSIHLFQRYADFVHIPSFGKYLVFNSCFHKSVPSVFKYFWGFPSKFQNCSRDFQNNFEH